jgi:hypothetical protein
MSFQWGRTDGTPASIEMLKTTVAESGVTGLSVTSTLRPGDKTPSGNTSYHSWGNAIDVAGPINKMDDYANFLKARYSPVIMELIHLGPNFPASAGVWNGAAHQYDAGLLEDHRNHVHIAMTQAGILHVRGTSGSDPGSGTPSTGTPVTTTPVGLTDSLDWLTDVGTWKRVSVGILGTMMVIIGTIKIVR